MRSLDRPRGIDGEQVISPEAAWLVESLVSPLHTHKLTVEKRTDLQLSFWLWRVES